MRLFLLLATAVLAFGGEDSWTKVTEIKSGSELKIYKKGSREALTAVMDEANADRIVVVMKNAQTAIAKGDIDRIDSRPASKPGSKMKVESTSKQTEPDYTPHPPNGVPVPGTSSSGSVSFGGGSKPYETVYRRGATGSEQSPQHPPSPVH